MINLRRVFKRKDSVAGTDTSPIEPDVPPPSSGAADAQKPREEEKEPVVGLDPGEVVAADGAHRADYLHVAAKDIMANGKERPIEVSRRFRQIFILAFRPRFSLFPCTDCRRYHYSMHVPRR